MGLKPFARSYKAIKSPDEMETLQMELCETMDAMMLSDGVPAPAATHQPHDHRRQADKDM